MDIESQVTDADAKDDEWGYDAAVDGGTLAETSVAERGDRPENNCHRRGHRINARERLIDLKNSVDHNLPLVGGGRNIADHVLQNTRNDESADRRGDDDGDARETVGDDRSEGDPVGGGRAPREAASTQEQQQYADHGKGVRGGGDHRKMRDLLRG